MIAHERFGAIIKGKYRAPRPQGDAGLSRGETACHLSGLRGIFARISTVIRASFWEKRCRNSQKRNEGETRGREGIH